MRFVPQGFSPEILFYTLGLICQIRPAISAHLTIRDGRCFFAGGIQRLLALARQGQNREILDSVW